MFDFKNTKKQGDVGLGAVIFWATKNSYTVSIPLTDSQDYDVVIDVDGVLVRTQVKTTSYKDEYNNYVASLTVKGGNRSGAGLIKKLDKSKVDAIFILTEADDMYFIYTKDLPGSSSVYLGEKLLKYKI